MASIPGARLDITGASGSQGLLSPKPGWLVYAFPRGGHAAQDSTGNLITFDSAAVASRFAVNNWVQVGLATSKLRKVAAVGGNSLNVQGSAVVVGKGDRIFLIGSTQPTTSGGSTTYLVPQSVIRQRGDDGADIYTNSMVTSDSNGTVQFFSDPAVYDLLVQDGNRTLQGSIVDLPVGLAEGVSTAHWSYFGATATFNANVGFTGTAVFGATVTMHGALGVTGAATLTGPVIAGATLTTTGRAIFNSAVTMNSGAGITGTLTIGSITGNIQQAGTLVPNAFSASSTFTGNVTISGSGKVLTVSGTGGIINSGGKTRLTGGQLSHGAYATFADGDTTPDVSGGNFFTAANTSGTTITRFDGLVDGEMKVIWIRHQNANTTYARTAASLRTSAATVTPTQHDIICFVQTDDTIPNAMNQAFTVVDVS